MLRAIVALIAAIPLTCGLLLAVSLLLRGLRKDGILASSLRRVRRALTVVLAICILPVAILELILRRWAGLPLWSLKRKQVLFAKHQNDGQGSWLLPVQVAASRDPEFSLSHWNEMKTGVNVLRVVQRWRTAAEAPELFRISGELEGSSLSFRNGERTTTGWPQVYETDVLCFGGSTTFCIEVSDNQTWPSVLQAKLNKENGRSMRVRNLGIPGTPGLERVNTFLWTTQPASGDIAVFLSGDNDSGWMMYGSREGQIHGHLPPWLRELLSLSEVFELSGWLYGELSPRYLRRMAIEMADNTIDAVERADSFARARGARVLFVLQPNIFTLQRPDDWDRRIMDATARDLPVLLEAAYGRYREWISTCDFAVDATDLFDNESQSPYMGDWSHVNSRGNYLIGEFVFNELRSRGWL